MIVASEITKRLFIWGVVAVSVLPRQHIDQTQRSIGGSLSYPFKRLLLAIAAINLVRLFMKESHIQLQVRVVADALGILQQLGYTFLCFLPPYLLQTWLAPLIHIGGRPGFNLKFPLYLATALSILSVILVRTVRENFCFLRKLGNVVSSPPVLKTLAMFNSITTTGGNHHGGRGTILSQSIMVIEYWFIATQILCAVGFALDRPDVEQSDYTQWDHLLASFREIAFISDWTRICAHALLMNQLDELYLISSPPQRSPNPNDNPTEANPENDAPGPNSSSSRSAASPNLIMEAQSLIVSRQKHQGAC